MFPLNPHATAVPDSGIIDLVKYGREKPGLIPLWSGESDQPTPQFICDAASAALTAGETFYTWSRGIPELRQALAAYHQRIYDRPFQAERFVVTGSGMQAIQMALDAVAGPGASVVVPTPAWPNCAAAAQLTGARIIELPLHFAPTGWRLDLEELNAAIAPDTRAIFINSPGNPTGWTATLAELTDLLALAKRRGLWIIADEVYHRLYYAADRAPSFYDLIGEDDPVLMVNTFSKNWAMTGWRMGWISAPEKLGQLFENLVQYSTSGVPAFLQRGAVAALDHGEPVLQQLKSVCQQNLDYVIDQFSGLNTVEFARPDGTFYFLFRKQGLSDCRRFAFDLIDQANVGTAPGSAFGEAGRGFVRICFARSPESFKTAVDRLSTALTAA